MYVCTQLCMPVLKFGLPLVKIQTSSIDCLSYSIVALKNRTKSELSTKVQLQLW